MSAPSAGQTNAMPRSRRPLVIVAVAVAVGVLVIAVATIVTLGRTANGGEGDGIDWSTFPLTLNCASVPKDPSYTLPNDVDSPAPEPIRTQTIRLEHTGGDRLRIELTMADPPPPVPDLISIPGYDPYYPVPGSLDFSVALFFDNAVDKGDAYVLTVDRNVHGNEDKQWTVSGNSSDFNDDTSDPARELDSEVVGNTISFTTDLADFPSLAEGWTSTPTAQVIPIEYVYPPRTDDDLGFRSPQLQQCSTSTAAPPTSAAPLPSSAPAAPTAQKRTESEESESGVLGGVPVPPGPCADGGICQLSAPNSDYYCTISRTGGFCSPPLGEPLSVGTDARLIKVGADGETGLLAESGGNSHIESRQSMQKTTLPYGKTMTAYGITCGFHGLTASASCRHDASGHGFTVNTRRYRFF